MRTTAAALTVVLFLYGAECFVVNHSSGGVCPRQNELRLAFESKWSSDPSGGVHDLYSPPPSQQTESTQQQQEQEQEQEPIQYAGGQQNARDVMTSSVGDLYGPPPAHQSELGIGEGIASSVGYGSDFSEMPSVNGLYAPPGETTKENLFVASSEVASMPKAFELYGPPVSTSADSSQSQEATSQSPPLQSASSLASLYAPPPSQSAIPQETTSGVPTNDVNPSFELYGAPIGTNTFVAGQPQKVASTNETNLQASSINSLYGPPRNSRDVDTSTSVAKEPMMASDAASSVYSLYGPPRTDAPMNTGEAVATSSPQGITPYSTFVSDQSVADLYYSGPPKAASQTVEQFESSYETTHPSNEVPPISTDPTPLPPQAEQTISDELISLPPQVEQKSAPVQVAGDALDGVEDLDFQSETDDTSSFFDAPFSSFPGVSENASNLWAKAGQFAKDRLDAVGVSTGAISETLETTIQDMKSRNPLLGDLTTVSGTESSIEATQRQEEQLGDSEDGEASTNSFPDPLSTTVPQEPVRTEQAAQQEICLDIIGKRSTVGAASAQQEASIDEPSEEGKDIAAVFYPESAFRGAVNLFSSKQAAESNGEANIAEESRGDAETAESDVFQEAENLGPQLTEIDSFDALEETEVQDPPEPRNFLRNVTGFFSSELSTEAETNGYDSYNLIGESGEPQRKESGNLFRNITDFFTPKDILRQPQEPEPQDLEDISPEQYDSREDSPSQNGFAEALTFLAAGFQAAEAQRKKTVEEFLSGGPKSSKAVATQSREVYSGDREDLKGLRLRAAEKAQRESSSFSIFKKKTPEPKRQVIRQRQQQTSFFGSLRQKLDEMRPATATQPRNTQPKKQTKFPPQFSFFSKRPSSGTYSLMDGLTTRQKAAIKERQMELKYSRMGRYRKTYPLKGKQKKQENAADSQSRRWW